MGATLAVYAFRSFQQYIDTGGGNYIAVGAPFDNDDDLIDVETPPAPDDGFFDIGEDIAIDNGGGVTGTFQGTLTIGLDEFVAVLTPSNVVLLFAVNDVATANFPATLAYPGDLNQSQFMVCFAEGTLIATRNGELPIEDLNIGDTLITANGRETFVKWVGRQTVVKVFSGPRLPIPVILTKANSWCVSPRAL